MAELAGRDHGARHLGNIGKDLVPAALHERLVFGIIPTDVRHEIAQAVVARGVPPGGIVDCLIFGHQLGVCLHPTLRGHQVVVVEHDPHVLLATIRGDLTDRGDVPPDGLVIKTTSLRIIWKITDVMEPPLV